MVHASVENSGCIGRSVRPVEIDVWAFDFDCFMQKKRHTTCRTALFTSPKVHPEVYSIQFNSNSFVGGEKFRCVLINCSVHPTTINNNTSKLIIL
ncbi:Homeodomain-interacting protein kinase [Trichinella pseudospiralis]